jgi:hypothetical protein
VPVENSKSEARNPKRFDRFDKLTARKLTALSKVEGRIQMTKISNPKKEPGQPVPVAINATHLRWLFLFCSSGHSYFGFRAFSRKHRKDFRAPPP